ncbi:MAG: Holliday junction branch migration protein RuvA [Oscillochloris sp.]|nr:Holliday junction branch migration protein RuvA [Oscillochloris sp.]
MIASVRGVIAALGIDHLVVETAGVGYLVYAPRPVLGSVGAVGDTVFLHTLLIVREDSMTLYGFAAVEQRSLFERFLTVSGIGPKVALNLLSAGATDEIRAAIAGGDTVRLARVPGIGKKTAERLVLELKGKIDLTGLPIAMVSGQTPAASGVNAELVELLVGLGYSSAESAAAIAAIPADAPPELEERLRLALRFFGSA